MGGVNWTKEQVRELYGQRGTELPNSAAVPKIKSATTKHEKAKKPQPIEGPLSVTLVLHGHCPSKKNDWQKGESGMFVPREARDKISALTVQAIFQWGNRGPVEHPDVTVKFFVSAKRQDRDGMWTTILDCLQKAGVLVNDNIARYNGTETKLPCEFVSEAEERVEIRIEKR